MDLDQLRCFVAVARAGTFTRAAEQEELHNLLFPNKYET